MLLLFENAFSECFRFLEMLLRQTTCFRSGPQSRSIGRPISVNQPALFSNSFVNGDGNMFLLNMEWLAPRMETCYRVSMISCVLQIQFCSSWKQVSLCCENGLERIFTLKICSKLNIAPKFVQKYVTFFKSISLHCKIICLFVTPPEVC